MFKVHSRTRSLAVLVALFAAGTSLSGCYGSFGLTKKLYQFNGSLGNKWVKSAFVLIVGHVAYGFCGVADAVVFNLIEFWTGSNPIASAPGSDFDQRSAEGTRVQGHVLDDGRLEVTFTPVKGDSKVVVLDRQVDGVNATAADGAFMAKVASAADGRTLLITPKAN